MPLDHYVSQVHLKNFYSPKLGKLIYAIRKADMKAFTPDAQSVCRIEAGNTNSYLRDDRAIEDFLKKIEPRYNATVAKLLNGQLDGECIFVIAGFAAYVIVCSPAGMRIQSNPLKGVVEETSRRLDARGDIPKAPPSLGGESLTQLLDSGKVSIKIDSKYPQAMGIASIESRTIAFGNFAWDILVNPFDDNPFFTSDFPVAIEVGTNANVLNRIVPLTPNLAIRIKPDPSVDLTRADASFSHFRHATLKLSRQQVISINRLIVRCAETTVFFRDDNDWVTKFIGANAAFRIEPWTQRIRRGKGTLLFSSQKISDNRGNLPAA